MDELRRVITYPHLISKYTIDPKAVAAFLTLLSRRARVTAGTYSVAKVDDPGDNMVLACALESGADYIVTGDPHLLNLKEFQGTRILSVADAAVALPETQPGR
jgi:putative PIN family toxin of toxin-antitoxin system